MTITLANAICDHITVVETMIKAKFYKNACRELYSMEGGGPKMHLVKKYALVLFASRSQSLALPGSAHLVPKQDILRLIQDNLQFLNLEQTLATVTDSRQDDDDLTLV